ncbi:MAG: ABC transporter transmembrane domain-containing protein, partial [Ruminiclostridium sp.]
MKQKQRSAVSWLAEFSGEKKSLYAASVIVAVLGVAFAMASYVIMGVIVANIVDGNGDWTFYLREGLIIVGLWLLRYVCHGISTTCSHKATFHVLATIRKRLCDKLAKVPLGLVKDTPSGSLKNIIVERVDSIETTLAHVLPEYTSNLLAPLAVFVYLLIIDWRMALVSLITLVIGMFAYAGMMIGYEQSYQNTVNKTKVLNDTAVEYINGIEVIKAFGKTKSSYEKFETAAKEGADCYVEWMRHCNVFFSIALVITPCTALAVVPIGGIFFMNGTLSLADLVMCLILSLGLITPLITVMSHMDDIAKVGTIIGEVTGILSWEELQRPEKDEGKISDYSIALSDVTFGYHE